MGSSSRNAGRDEARKYGSSHPGHGTSFTLQVPEGVPSGAVPPLPAAQVPAAQTLHLLQLALPEPEEEEARQEERPDIQLLRRYLLREVRRDNRPLPAWR